MIGIDSYFYKQHYKFYNVHNNLTKRKLTERETETDRYNSLNTIYI